MHTEFTIFEKICSCGNTCIVTGYVDREDGKIVRVGTETTIPNAMGNVSCGFAGKMSIRCGCGKLHRGINWRQWRLAQFWEKA